MSATRGKDARQRFAPTSTHRRLRGGRNYCHIAKHLHCSCGRNNTPISSPGWSCWPDLSDNVAPTCLRTHSRLPEQLAPSTPKMPMHQILTVSHPPPINMLVFVSLRETQIFSTLTISSILAQLARASPHYDKVAGSIPTLAEHIQATTNECISKWNNKPMFFSLSLSLSNQ